MKITYLGTTMLLFDDGRDQILFDCHVTRPTMKTCLRKKLNTDTKLSDRVISDFKMDRLKAIFISHSHYDHILDAPYFAKKCSSHFYGSESSLNVAIGNGVESEYLHSYEENHDFQVGDFYVTVIPSIHSAPRWYNDDIGEKIIEPFALPAPKSAFKEGGSYDFLITYKEKRFLIRPSYNYIEGQFDQVQADYLFLGIGGMSKDSKERHAIFLEETIGKIQPKIVIPVHWDNFFTPLYGDVKVMPVRLENTGKAFRILADYCNRNSIQCLVQLPCSSLEIE